MERHRVRLGNGWTADFQNQGEFRMGAEAWNMLLMGPGSMAIRHFENEIVLVNDQDGFQARSCIKLSEDGHRGYLSTGVEAHWVLDFERCRIAPHRLYIHHGRGDKQVAVYEQPAFRQAQGYVTIDGQLIYFTFPLCSDDEFPPAWEQYLSIRRRQLDEAYWGT